MMRLFTIIAALFFFVVIAVAQQDLISQSRALMKSTGKNMAGVLSSMAKGEKPYDQVTVDAALEQLNETARKLPTLFPESLKSTKWESDYAPSTKIWENKVDFDSKIAGFSSAVADAVSKVKDIDSLKASMSVIGKQCGGCHETYRIRNS